MLLDQRQLLKKKKKIQGFPITVKNKYFHKTFLLLLAGFIGVDYLSDKENTAELQRNKSIIPFPADIVSMCLR